MPRLPAAPMDASTRMLRALGLVGVLWAALVVIQFGAAPATLDLDIFHQMALARELFAMGHIPLRDSFAYTPTLYPVIHHEWGMGLIMYAVAMHGGLAGLYVLLLAFVAGILAVCIAVARRGGADWPAIIVCLLIAGPLGIVGFGAVRAQFVTVLLMAILLYMLESDRRGGRAWMAGWLLIFVAWVNLHGGFLVGLGVIGIYWIETVVRTRRGQVRLPVLLVLSIALSGISPYGYAHLAGVIAGVRMARPIIAEWRPLWTEPFRFTAFIISLMPLIYCLRKSLWKGREGLLLVMVCGLLAVEHERHSSLYAVAWLCYVPAWFAATLAGRALAGFWERQARLLLGLLVGFVVLMTVSLIARRQFRVVMPTEPADLTAFSVLYPVGPAEYLAQQHFRGKVMTSFDMGAFVSWKLAPDVKVSIDSRYEAAYAPALAAEMVSFYDAGAHWRATLERYPPDLVLVRNDDKIVAKLAAESSWKRVYEDDAYSLYGRAGMGLPVVDRTGQPLSPSFP